MRQDMLIKVFAGIVFLGLILRIFIFDLVILSNDDLAPQFYSRDVLLVSRLGVVQSGQWALVKDDPAPGNYSVRRIVRQEGDMSWIAGANSQNSSESKPLLKSQILGRVVIILWSKSCVSGSGECSSRSYKFLTFVN